MMDMACQTFAATDVTLRKALPPPAEADPYDTGASRWVAVHGGGLPLAAGRLTPTMHRQGAWSYRLRDGQRGLVPGLPRDLLFGPAPVDARVWEGALAYLSDDVPACDRLHMQLRLTEAMLGTLRTAGAAAMLIAIPHSALDLVAGLGAGCEILGPVHDQFGQMCVCVRIAVGR